jgi:arylsulfatase A-like enzyme
MMNRSGCKNVKSLIVGIFALLTLVLVIGSCNVEESPEPHYNIILIMADDLGAETIGAYGGSSYETPMIDQMAIEGVQFENAHSQPLCTPSRVKIMTGQYNFRNYEEFAYLKPGSVTFGNILKDVGYQTLVAGKWQLVRSTKALPDVQGMDPVAAGFDEYFLWQLTPEERRGRYWNPTIADNTGLTTYPETDFGPSLVNERVLDYMQRNREEPFFIYYPMILPHAPFVATPDYPDAETEQERFGAMMAYVDKMVGNVRQKAIDLGIADRTVIIFTGDNGTHGKITSTQNGVEVKGGKGKTDATGTHVPFIVWGPVVGEGGQKSLELVNFSDVLPTLVEVAGEKLPDGLTLDGRSLVPFIQNPGKTDRQQMFIHYEPRWGKQMERLDRYAFDTQWKLYEDGRLFDLAADPGEASALAEDRVEADALLAKQRLNELIEGMGQSVHFKEESQPNVLLIMSDDLNMDLGTYGHPLVQSPNIDALANSGVAFSHAYSQYPVCNPSRSSLLTSLYPEQNGVIGNGPNFRDKVPNVKTLPQLLKENGYWTGRVGKIFHYGVPNEIGTPGRDDPISWNDTVNPIGIDANLGQEGKTERISEEISNVGGALNWLSLPSEDSEHTDYKVATETIHLLEEHHPDKTGKPFFLAAGFYRPHVPSIAPSKYFDRYPLEDIVLPERRDDDRDDIPLAALADRPYQLDMTELQKKKVTQAYYATVTFMDAQVGRLLTALREQGLEDDTIVIFMSDHGFHLGAHDLWQKADLFEGSVRAPLIVSVPGAVANGKPSAAMVEYLDLYPTLMDLLGFEHPGWLEGQSLVPLLRGETEQHRPDSLSMARSVAFRVHKELEETSIMGYTLRTDRYRYTEWNEGEYGVELYDYENDPMEFTNLAGKAEVKDIQETLAKRLALRRTQARTAAVISHD